MEIQKNWPSEVTSSLAETGYWMGYHNPYEKKGTMLDYVCDILANDPSYDEFFEGDDHVPAEAFRRYMTGFWQSSTSRFVRTALRPKRFKAIKSFLQENGLLPHAALRKHEELEAIAYRYFMRSVGCSHRMGEQYADTGCLRGMFYGRRLQGHEMVEFVQLFHHIESERLIRVREFAFRFLDDFEDELILDHHCRSQDYLEHQVRDGFVAIGCEDGLIFLLDGSQSRDAWQSMYNFEFDAKGHRIRGYQMHRYGDQTRMTLCQRPADIERSLALLQSL